MAERTTLTAREIAALRYSTQEPTRWQQTDAARWARRHGQQPVNPGGRPMRFDRAAVLALHEEHPPTGRSGRPRSGWCAGRHGGPHEMVGDNVMPNGGCRACRNAYIQGRTA